MCSSTKLIPSNAKKSSNKVCKEGQALMSAYFMNNTPYLTEENKELLAPIDIIAPWNEADVRIRELTDSTLKDLVKERRALLVKLESLLEFH